MEKFTKKLLLEKSALPLLDAAISGESPATVSMKLELAGIEIDNIDVIAPFEHAKAGDMVAYIKFLVDCLASNTPLRDAVRDSSIQLDSKKRTTTYTEGFWLSKRIFVSLDDSLPNPLNLYPTHPLLYPEAFDAFFRLDDSLCAARGVKSTLRDKLAEQQLWQDHNDNCSELSFALLNLNEMHGRATWTSRNTDNDPGQLHLYEFRDKMDEACDLRNAYIDLIGDAFEGNGDAGKLTACAKYLEETLESAKKELLAMGIDV